MAKYTVEDSTMTGLADEIRRMWYTDDTMTPAQMITKLASTNVGVPIKITSHIDAITGNWVRPTGWPNLDAIEIEDTDLVVYMTYDLTKTPGQAWIGVWVNGTSGSYYVDRGHLNNNNEFVVDETNTVTLNSYFRKNLDSTNGNVQLWRITSDKNITGFAYCGSTDTASTQLLNMYQPCVERVGRLNHSSIIWGSMSVSATTNRTYGTYWLERDGLVTGKNVAIETFAAGWYCCYSLLKLDTEKWDTSNWKVKNMSSNWSNCISLPKLDLSTWDTSGWLVTTLDATWNNCYSLYELKIGNWDTEDWAVTALSSTWNCCNSLKELDLSGWKTSNWAVTTLLATWNRCNNLKKLDVSTWNTSNWAVTNLTSTWQYCLSLLELDLNNWNTSNWAVTGNLSYTWGYCNSLLKLNIGSWNTSGWNINNLSNAWNACYCLKELNLNNWDTSNWTVTGLTSTFNSCFSLTTLGIDKWNTENWEVTSLEATFSTCYSLKSLDLSDWDTSNWKVTTLKNMFYNCYSLEELKINDWDTSDWAVTSMYYTWYWCNALKTLDISDWDTTNWAVTTTQYMFSGMQAIETILCPASLHLTSHVNNTGYPSSCYNLVTFNGFDMVQSFNLYSTYKLSAQSLVNMLTRLATVSSKTATIGVNNIRKLTSEQIAIATQKGWTVA